MIEEKLIQNIQKSSTVLGVAVAFAIPLVVYAGKKIEETYYNYTDEKLNEIKKIREFYQDYCYKMEKNNKYLSTLIVQGEETKQRDYPIFFEIEENGRGMRLKNYSKFSPTKDADSWSSYLDPDSILRHAIDEAIGYICDYQYNRDKRWFGKGYDYDPTNLFFEEFKWWLVAFCRAPLNRTTLEIVEGRIQYLDKIRIKEVFRPSDCWTPTRVVTVCHIKEILENIIKPTTQICIDRENSRVHFSKLKKHVETSIKDSVKFLFYVFNSNKLTPPYLVFDLLRYPHTEDMRKITCKRSARLLIHLISSPIFRMVFPTAVTKNNVLADQPLISNQSSIKNDFIDVEGKLYFPFQENQITLDNWYKGSDSGILSFFQRKEWMDIFLKIHGTIQKMCLFYLICNSLVELAELGGDILVYSYAVTKVKVLLENYTILFKDLLADFSILDRAAEDFQLIVRDKSINGRSYQPSSEDKAWMKRFWSHHNSRRNLETQLGNLSDVSIEIQSRISAVNSVSYVETVKKKLEFYLNLVDNFIGKPQIINALPKTISPSPNLEMPVPAKNYNLQNKKVKSFLLDSPIFSNSHKPTSHPVITIEEVGSTTDQGIIDFKDADIKYEDQDYNSAVDLYTFVDAKPIENLAPIEVRSLARFYYCWAILENDEVTYKVAKEHFNILIIRYPSNPEPYLVKAKLQASKAFIKDALITLKELENHQNNDDAKKLKLELLQKVIIEEERVSFKRS